VPRQARRDAPGALGHLLRWGSAGPRSLWRIGWQAGMRAVGCVRPSDDEMLHLHQRPLLFRRAELLPVEYFQVVFTLPHALNPLAQGNARVLYTLLFQAARERKKVPDTYLKPTARFPWCGVSILWKQYRRGRPDETLPSGGGTPCPRPTSGHAPGCGHLGLSEPLYPPTWETKNCSRASASSSSWKLKGVRYLFSANDIRMGSNTKKQPTALAHEK
jgi:hypothetical protein